MKLINAIKQKQASGFVPIIAEVKRYTPSAVNPVEQSKDKRNAGILARQYQQGGACGISIVCESKYFGGEPEKDIPEVFSKTKLPILIKDFISSKKQVAKYIKICSRAKNFTKDRIAILLIAHHLRGKLVSLAKYCITAGVCPVIEIQQLEDLQYVSSLKEKDFLIGFNNRNIDSLEIKANSSALNKNLINCLRKRYRGIVISESGHLAPNDVRTSIEAGAGAILVGTAFMKARDPKKTVEKFVNAFDGET